MRYAIVSLNVGRPTVHHLGGQEIKTGFIKKPTHQPHYLSITGFEEDGQADLKNHGGEEKALLLYPKDHYPFWEEKYQRDFSYPAFGENITIDGLTERDLYIGDVFQLGEAEIQVSQPRQPCYKIAKVHDIQDMPAVLTETGYSGYYFRVLKEGIVEPTDQLIKVKEDPQQVTPVDVFHCLFQDRKNRERMEQYLQIEALAPNVKRSLTKRIEKLG
ncbi:MOSC domain-containing protein YiiM [Gracilibacillus orientalis]|uniref:MOSC domain-containing protein YiiM n=1 Tax=Gracilibacillus orientalis TaxID=334253 RepID=A0A1I4R127_9BACI|nr:MOSC domain-containing protein [Gracilibacillus orientalis]SFM46022.1 MOSC domain-containing protein YiiM [Gracilibacillus orientalis]